jgi:xanthine phosphoribosyltransferase
VRRAGATAVGAGIVIEKTFQGGGERVRETGLRVNRWRGFASMSEAEGVKFC